MGLFIPDKQINGRLYFSQTNINNGQTPTDKHETFLFHCMDNFIVFGISRNKVEYLLPIFK